MGSETGYATLFEQVEHLGSCLERMMNRQKNENCNIAIVLIGKAPTYSVNSVSN